MTRQGRSNDKKRSDALRMSKNVFIFIVLSSIAMLFLASLW